MTELVKLSERYWVISISFEDAHLVEADSLEEIKRNPINTFQVHYRDLRYNYINIDQEAQNLAKERKSQINPRILLDQNNTLDYILALPQMKGREIDRDSLTKSLELIRIMPEDLQKRRIKEYEEMQQKSEAQLYQEIINHLRQKQNYYPTKIKNLTPLELKIGLPQAGYITGRKGFVSMSDALDGLYQAWQEIRNDLKKTKSKFYISPATRSKI